MTQATHERALREAVAILEHGRDPDRAIEILRAAIAQQEAERDSGAAQDERAAFEKWWASIRPAPASPAEYSIQQRHAWIAWQARAALSRSTPAALTDEQIDRALSVQIPGGSAARDWFLPHETPQGLQNVREVVRCMFAVIASMQQPDARSSVVQHSGQEQDAKDAALYRELLFAVGKKWPGESRHETALRYIRRAEEDSSDHTRDAAIHTQGTSSQAGTTEG